jgi:hypothetical protein
MTGGGAYHEAVNNAMAVLYRLGRKAVSPTRTSARIAVRHQAEDHRQRDGATGRSAGTSIRSTPSSFTASGKSP